MKQISDDKKTRKFFPDKRKTSGWRQNAEQWKYFRGERFPPFPVKRPPAHLGLMNLPPGFDEPPTDDTNSEY